MRTPAGVTAAAAAGLLLASGAAADPGGMRRASASLDEESAGRLAALALACLHREYPNRISHVLQGDADVRPPRELSPAFYGCYDWHSSVHGHWMLARLARLYPGASWTVAARAALARSLTRANLDAEVSYLDAPGRTAFERPYGLAWLLALAGELRAWDDDDARGWAAAIEPLESAAAARLAAWLPKLLYPVRSGEHSQTAFALGLARDWALTARHEAMRALVDAKALQFYLADRACPIAYEPSGEDFLSPCLAEADLMRRVLPRAEFSDWLAAFLPGISLDGSAGWLLPAEVSDRTDPKLAHLDGLNLSRAWMLEGIAAGLADGDPRRPGLLEAADAHALAAVPAVTGEHYEGGHWLGSFAVYLLTEAGRSPR
ncbi:MAG: DUF2891 domain-containing protein [Steroidobacteraceae bacterium]|jgi:hypothetical protein|nr:DUF2891 domain-containing protein [Steroidobacteraceae bacterium]